MNHSTTHSLLVNKINVGTIQSSSYAVKKRNLVFDGKLY